MHRRAASHHASAKPGFTLIELLVSMGIASVVLLTIVSLFTRSNQAYIGQDQLVAVEQNVRAALEILAHEARMAGFIPLENLGAGTRPISPLDRVETATANSFQFLADIDGNDLPTDAVASRDDNAERLLYALNGTNLERTVWSWDGAAWNLLSGGPVTVAENITTLLFEYTFADGTKGIPDEGDTDLDNDMDDIRGVTVTLTGQSRNDGGGGTGLAKVRTRTLRSTFRLRNMGLDTTID